MTSKSLKNKAISIKGKDYVLVKDRIIFFNENYSAGMIQTMLLSAPGDEMVVIKAKVTPDVSEPKRYFTGYSQAVWGKGMVNETAALENAETSAVGRALAMFGIGVIDSVASVDEMNKAGVKNIRPVVDQETCLHEDVGVFQAKKEGENKGKWFKGCKTCKKFLGWVEK